MFELQTQELLNLCEALICDGELSVEEVHDLANWLNHHPSACDEWPGNVLVEPLQQIWADGKVGKTELGKIARLIGSILRQKAKQERQRMKEEATLEVLERIETAAASFDRLKASTPSLDVSIPIPSETDRKTKYTVILTDPSCTCPDWVMYRSRDQRRALSRCCKHILKAYVKLCPQAEWESWFQSFCEGGIPIPPRARASIIPVKGRLYLVTESKPPWWNVVGPETENSSGRYGFNVTEQRWSYDHRPANSTQIRDLINTLA